jgi:glucosamine--fructose-6-phosphate aminotransferase (isomerizing)
MTDITPVRQAMYTQIVSQPALLQEIFESAEARVRRVLEDFEAQRWQAIYTAGCGDSFYAGLACEMAFARFCRLPVKALPAMTFARYEVDNLAKPAVVFGISNSGAVSRSLEAVALARSAGADTIAITGYDGSAITREAAAAIALPIAPMGRSPGIRSYTVQLLTLLLCALRLGELRQTLSAAEAATWRQRLRDVAVCMEATIQANTTLTRQIAEHLHDTEEWLFVGAGPSYATALFSAAKMVESCGANAWAQELEEWGHIQFFNRQEGLPTCLLVPPGRSVDRALELLPYIKGIGRYTLLVAEHGLPLPSAQIDMMLPLPQSVPEVFSPLVTCLPGELLAYYLAEVKGTQFFTAPLRGVSNPGDRLRNSRILDSLEALSDPAASS